MIAPFYNLSMLALECQHVVVLRLVKLAFGGSCALDEAHLMVSEKVAEAGHAAGRLISGASVDSIVVGYREIVRANVLRLQHPAQSGA